MDDETPATESISAESPDIPNEENVEQELAPEELSTLEESVVDDPDMDQEEAQAEDERESDNPATEEDEDALAEDEQEAVLAAEDPAEDRVHEEYKEEAIEQAPVEEAQKERPGCYSDGEDEDTPLPTQIIDNDVNEEEQDADASRRQSGASERRTSLRTEALIQAAAREVVAKIEANARERYSMRHSEGGADDSILSSSTHDTYAADGTEMAYEDQSDTSGRQSHRSSGSRIHHHVAPHSISGDSSSHPEGDDDDDDDDVFSDRSPRSSLGSMDGSNDAALKLAPAEETKAARISRVSDISGLSQYDKEEDEFVPTSRDTPRIPFRTPSAVRAIQMSSPTPSVYSGATPRSSRRHHNHNPGLCTVSRLGSPNAAAAAAQYSPKGRPTPPRFKPKEAAPLVLLHVTLLPLRWAWGDVLDATGDDGDEKPGLGRKGAVGFQPSDELRRLRDSWRQLRDRVGDTVLERGVLLPHPQNDYEVLEERLLEALELPLRRRARILECGHYVGPADEMADDDDGEGSEDEEGSRAGSTLRGLADARKQRHWCGTCRGEIRFEDLGPGKVFRVKVYASNGLMRAGAWAACWKEMERVDVELEPIVETALLRELERLSAVREEEEEERQREREQQEEEEHLQRELAQGQEQLLPVRQSAELYHTRRSPTTVSSPPLPTPMSIAAMRASPPEPLTVSPVRAVRIRDPLSPAPVMAATPPPPPARLPEPIDTSEARRHRDEERLREIYGRTPPRARFVDMGEDEEDEEEESPVRAEHATPRLDHDHHHADSSYVAPSSPTSPSEEAFDRRSARHHEEQHQHQHHHPHHQYEHHHQQQNQNYNNHNSRPYQTASLPELLLEAGRVLLRDRRNVAIALLSLFVLMLAVRPGPGPVPPVPAAYLHHHHRPTFGEEVRDGDVDVGVRGQGREGEGAGVVFSEEVMHETPVEVEEEKVVVQVLETVTETVRVSVTVSTVVGAEATAEAGVEALELAVYEAEGETVVVTGSEAVVEVETEVVNVVETQVGTETETRITLAETETESEASIATASATEEPVERAASESAEVDPAAPMVDEGVEEKGNEE